MRLRPTLDLVKQVGALVADFVVDLGCGDGAASTAL
jgi:trans-aconitate methyltransferase